ncbi:hypothetical protein D9615_001437 [Tricholomella constricta]|nr:hypothetical protein D9615_001437 [Tricholomella constricta]
MNDVAPTRPPFPSQAAGKKTPLPSKDKDKQPPKWLVVSHSLTPIPIPAPAPTQQGPGYIPPQALTVYPPLVRYTNALLGVLNVLRLLASVRIMQEVVEALERGRAGEELGGVGWWRWKEAMAMGMCAGLETRA